MPELARRERRRSPRDPRRSKARATVVLADDNEYYRRGVARAIRAHARLNLLAERADGQAALEAILELQPDVAVLDRRMPGMGGIQVCRRLAALATPVRTRVVVLSAMDDLVVEHRALAAGASAYISKYETRPEICRRVARIAFNGGVLR